MSRDGCIKVILFSNPLHQDRRNRDKDGSRAKRPRREKEDVWRNVETRCAKIVDATNPVLILDADTHPDVRRPVEMVVESREALRALGEDLETVGEPCAISAPVSMSFGSRTQRCSSAASVSSERLVTRSPRLARTRSPHPRVSPRIAQDG